MEDGTNPTTLINLAADSDERSQNHTNPSSIPVIPTEDSYFSETPAHPKSLGLRDLGVILNSKRRATLHVAIRGAGTSWLDQDDSGTYDPKKDRATPTRPATPPRRKKRAKTYDENDESITPPPPPRKRPPVGYRSLMTFAFTSEKALNYLQSIPPGPFHSQSTTPDGDLSDSAEPEEECGFGPLLKKRKTRRLRKVREISERKDGLTIDQLTIGHPQLRGCKACFEIGDDDCSLIDHGQDYPCTACDDASIDCEYIAPPELKKACERCKRRHFSCSYSLDGDKGLESCDACSEAEIKCLAAPLKGSVRKFGDASSAIVPPPRQYVSCNQCRNNSLRCNLKRDQPGPCSYCRNNGEDCQFVLIPTSNPSLSITPPPKKPRRGQKAGRKHTRKTTPVQSHDSDVDHTPGRPGGHLDRTLRAEALHHGALKRRPQTLINERERSSKKQEKIEAEARKRFGPSTYTSEFTPPLGISSGIPHTKITTAFSHPIKFNYIPDPKGTSPCTWCSELLFGLYGYGDIEVEVVPFPAINGHGYEEMPGGHADKGAPSQMCVECTCRRVNIMSCEKHEFQIIEVDPRVNDRREIENSFRAQNSGDEIVGQLATNMKWCSICPMAAHFRCCARQDEDNLIGEVMEEGQGCGLYLCMVCKDLMAKVTGPGIHGAEVLDRAVRVAANDRFTYRDGVRADASFLTSKGELMVRIQKGMGENDAAADADDGAQSSESEDGNEEIWTILERVGKGKGKWNEKQKPAPAVQRRGQAPTVPIFQQLKQPAQGGMGQKRNSSSESSSRRSQPRQLQMSFGSGGDYVFDSDREESNRREAGRMGGGESSGAGMRKYGSSSNGNGKGKGKGKAPISAVVVISDDEDD